MTEKPTDDEMPIHSVTFGDEGDSEEEEEEEEEEERKMKKGCFLQHEDQDTHALVKQSRIIIKIADQVSA